MLPHKYVLFLCFYVCIQTGLDEPIGAGDTAWFVEMLPNIREMLGLVPALHKLDVVVLV